MTPEELTQLGSIYDKAVALRKKIEDVEEKMNSIYGIHVQIFNKETNGIKFDTVPKSIQEKCVDIIRQYYQEKLIELKEQFINL